MISQTLQGKIKDALKSGDAVRASTYRLLLSALNNENIAKMHELSEEEELAVVRRQLKQRGEAIEAYEKASRIESAEKEKQEAQILQEFLPEQLESTQIEQIVEQIIIETKPSGMSDFGRVMGEAMKRVAGRADGKVVSNIVRQKLG